MKTLHFLNLTTGVLFILSLFYIGTPAFWLALGLFLLTTVAKLIAYRSAHGRWPAWRDVRFR